MAGGKTSTSVVQTKLGEHRGALFAVLDQCKSLYFNNIFYNALNASSSLIRKKFPLYHPLHRRHLPPDHLRNSVCLLDACQKV